MKLPWAAWLLGLVVPSVVWAQVPISEDPTAVFVMKVDGSDVRKVAQVENFRDHGSPRWSNDGKRLVFDAAVARHGPRKCFVVNVDGTGLRELCDGELPDWSPDDKQIAYQASSQAGALPEIYVQNLDGQGRLKIAEGYSPRWSPDGGRLAISDRSMLRVADLLSGQETPLFDQPFGVVFNGCAWSPDGKRLAVAVAATYPGPRELLVVDAAGNNRAVKPRLRNQLGGLISFSPDGKQIIFSNDFQLHIVDVEGAAPPRLVPGQQGQNRYPAWSPDGKWIAFTSTRTAPQPPGPNKPATPRGKKFEEIERHHKGTIVYSLAFTPDSRRLVLGCDPRNTGVQVWNLATGETRELGGRGIRIQMFPDGRRFATAWHHPIAQIIDLESGNVLREFDHGSRIWAFALSRDGRRLLTGGLDKVVRTWDVETGRQLYASDPYADWITRAAFSPDGKQAITAGHDQMLRVWDVETGRQRLAIKHPAAVWGLAVTPDGRQILTGTGGSLTSSLTVLKIAKGEDNVLRMWDSATGELVREMKGHTDVVYSIDVSPDGRLAVTGGSDGTMRLWDLATGDELCKTKPRQGRVPCVAFSPDGKLIVAGGGARWVGNQIVEYPSEQVWLYKVVDADGPTAQAGGL
jgi:WD40 repeat protein